MNELSKDLLCIYMRFGLEIWVERERALKFYALLGQPNAPQFTEIDGNLVNRADVAGVFTAASMDEFRRRKNGEWKCYRGTWHEKRVECNCRKSDEEVFDPGPEITPEQRKKNLDALGEARRKFLL